MKDEKDQRKELSREYKRKELAGARASCPLSNTDLRALFDWVDERLIAHGCDDTLTHARAFLEARALPVATTVVWLEQQGGFCDCEIIANVETI